MLYPMKLDLARRRVLQIEMDEAAFRAASFLDGRMLTPEVRGGWVALDPWLASSVAQPGTLPLHFIFHTGHVGSTLVSRLLDETGYVQPTKAQLMKVPYMLVVGDREREAGAVAVRTRAGEDLGSMPSFQFIDRLRDEVATGMDPESAGPDLS